MNFRKILFWFHLAAGVFAGLVIAVMCFTGAALAFESEIVAHAERDARVVSVPAGTARLSLAELRSRVKTAAPDTRITGITVSADPAAAVAFAAGREAVYYANPYTGEVRTPASTAARDFMRAMESWHRALALSGDRRDTGRTVTGACNAAFLFLGLSGLYLWWPRKWRLKGLRRSFWFVKTTEARARDWNWHNVFGFWMLPAIVVMAASGMVMSYRWANNLVYHAAGENPPAAGGPGAPTATTTAQITQPAPGARPASYDVLAASVATAIPDWTSMIFRLGVDRRRGGDGPPGNAPRADRTSSASDDSRSAPSPVSVSVRTASDWPPFATTTLALDPFTGAVLQKSTFADNSPGRRARTWIRFLHTGEALAWPGQLIAGLGCLAGLVLVYTGFALAIRRLLRFRQARATGPT